MSIFFTGLTSRRIALGSSNALLQENAAQTISAWIKPDSMGTADAGRIISKETAGGNGLRYIMRTNNAIVFIVSGTTSLSVESTMNTITTGSWQHVACVYAGNNSAIGVDLFRDGIEMLYGTTANGVNLTDNAANQISIGNRGDHTRSFDGDIAELAVWDTTLTPFEISILASARIVGLPLQVRPGNLRGYWPLNDFSDNAVATGSSTIIDRSGNNLHGTPVNNPSGSADGILSYA